MRAQRHWLRPAVVFLVAATISVSVDAAESPLRHTFQVTYRGFGPVSVESQYIMGSAYDLRPEGCYARASSEAVCGFTLKAHGPITLTNLQNPSHALRADGSTTRTCCVFVAGDPNGYPLTAPGAPTAGVRPLERHLRAGETLDVILRIPDYGAGAPIAGVVFSSGGGDPGVKSGLVGPRSGCAGRRGRGALTISTDAAERTPPAADPRSDGLPLPRRRWALVAIWLAMAMAVIDASIANVALPAIARDLHADPASSVWIVNAYQIAIVVSLLPLAALGEIIAYRRVFLAGLVVFTLASIACALSPNLPILGVARTLQGLGAAGLMSVSAALLRYTLPKDRLGRGVGLNALVISIAAVLGPTIASAILAVGSWPLLFWVNAPLGVPTVLIAMRALPHSPRSKRRLDWIAVGLNVLAFGLIFTGVDILTRERLPLVGGGVILMGILAAGLLVRRSIGQAQPLLPLDLMARPLFALTVLTSVASFAAQMLAFVALPFFFQGTLHKTQVATGVLVTPWPIAVGVAAPLAGRLADRFPAAILSFAGLGCLALGLGLIAALTPGAGAFDIAWRMALCGLGFGFFQAPNNRTLIMAAPMERTGAAGGMLATARLTGQTVGATAAAALFSVSASGSRNALLLGAAFAAAAAFVSISRLGGSRR